MHFDWRVFKRDLKSVYSVTLFLTINGFFYNEPNFSHFSILPLHNDLLEAASNKPSTHKALSHIRQIPKNSAKSLISFSFFLDQYSQAALNTLHRYSNPYQKNLYDPQGVLALAMGVYGTPETWLIDADGIIRQRYAGEMTQEIWRQQFAPLLEQWAKVGSL